MVWISLTSPLLQGCIFWKFNFVFSDWLDWNWNWQFPLCWISWVLPGWKIYPPQDIFSSKHSHLETRLLTVKQEKGRFHWQDWLSYILKKFYVGNILWISFISVVLIQWSLNNSVSLFQISTNASLHGSKHYVDVKIIGKKINKIDRISYLIQLAIIWCCSFLLC